MVVSVERGGLLILGVVLLAGCTGQKSTDAVAKAAPYLTDALTLPMQVLYRNATAGDDARDSLRLGLALAAGRRSPVTVGDTDGSSLAALDARLQSAKREWLKENPPGSENQIPWSIQIHLSADEAAIIERAEQATSAEYWLSRAEAATDTNYISTVSPGRFTSMPGSVALNVPAIDRNVLLTAAACAAALRGEVGLPASSVPEVILRLRDRSVHDVSAEAAGETHRSQGEGNRPVSPAACGSRETFDDYVAMLKAATRSSA